MPKTDTNLIKREMRAGSFMTPEQFDALMRICGFQAGGKNHEGLRLVLQEGHTVYEVERAGIVAKGNLSAAMSKIREKMADVELLHSPAIRLPAPRTSAAKKS